MFKDLSSTEIVPILPEDIGVVEFFGTGVHANDQLIKAIIGENPRGGEPGRLEGFEYSRTKYWELPEFIREILAKNWSSDRYLLGGIRPVINELEYLPKVEGRIWRIKVELVKYLENWLLNTADLDEVLTNLASVPVIDIRGRKRWMKAIDIVNYRGRETLTRRDRPFEVVDIDEAIDVAVRVREWLNEQRSDAPQG